MQQATLPSVGTNWHILQLRFQGNQITVACDGNQVLSAEDAEASPYSSGAIGLELYAETTPYTFSVENVTVTGSTVASEPDPVANNDSYDFTENTTLTVATPGVLANDTDTAGYTLTAVLVTGPAHGTLTLNPNGGFTYVPATNFSGTDSFTYYASDGASNSAVATVTLSGIAKGIVFSDNFARATNPGPLTPWLAESGAWTVTGGMLEGTGSANAYGAVYITNSWSNCTVQASLQFSTASGYGAGISGRLNPATGARYAAWIYPENSPSGGPLVKLVKFQSWTSWSYQGRLTRRFNKQFCRALAPTGTPCNSASRATRSRWFTMGTRSLSAADGEASPYSSGAVGFDMYTGTAPYTLSAENVTLTQ